jgi:hypothetical protein
MSFAPNHRGRTSNLRIASIALCFSLLIGCTPPIAPHAPTTAPAEPIGRQMLRVAPDLKDARFSNLLSFEADTDAVFIISPNDGARIDDTRAHTGSGSLRVNPGTPGFSVKLASLLAGRQYPGDWTLVGAYFYSDRTVEMTATCSLEGTTSREQHIELKPDTWTALMLDISTFPNHGSATPPTLRFSFPPMREATVWCDDVTLIDNSQWYVGNGSEDSTDGWKISRRGFTYIGEMPGRFAFKLDSAEGHVGGWTLEEANAMRARFSSGGDVKTLTVYSDGRAYWDGEYKPMASPQLLDSRIPDEHSAPADVEIPEGAGRLDRRSKGDANNDGYNETTATYRIISAGPRLELKINPRTPVLIRPVLEIRGLPPGKVLATVEGKLVDKIQRLEDGSVLLELPAGIERRTTVNISVSDAR